MTKKPKPSELPSEDLERRDYSQKERDAMDDSDFGDPANQAFPIKVAKDVIHAAERLHNAKGDQDAIKKRIVAIAKRKGFPLPETWQEHSDDERSVKPDDQEAPKADDEASSDEEQDEDGEDSSKEPMKNKDKNKTEDKEERSLPSPDVLYYAPITRFDKEKREVIGVATAEVKDMHRTVIGYEGSKDAFSKWRGNIREMHDPHKAVGRALEITPDDDNRRIIVRARISKGAEDTWQKVLDGTLTGFSIGGKNGVWTERTIDGEKVPYLERYDQAELSLVDNPSCPVANFEIVRADGIAGEALAPEDEAEPEVTRVEEAEVERAGAKISAETREAMHTARDHSMNGAKQIMATCGCDDCMDCMNRIAEHDDNDGDIDANYMAKPGAARAMIAEIVKEQVADTLRTQIGPVIQRINALLAHDAGRDVKPDFTRNFTSLSEKHDALASQIKDIADLVQKIAEQPTSGGPLMHGVQKQLATSPAPARVDDADIIRRATEMGFAPPSDPQAAVRAAAALVRPIPR
jgi:hypothetical protein